MAAVKRIWVKPLAVAVLLLGTGWPARAQTAPTGSLIGKLTDLHSAPLAGVTILLHNQATGTEVRATTAKDGAYRFAGLPAGVYALFTKPTLESETAATAVAAGAKVVRNGYPTVFYPEAREFRCV